MRPAPSIATAQFGAFTTGQAHDAGWTPSALRHAVANGYLDRLRVGAYGVPIEPTGRSFDDAVANLCRAAAAVSLTNRGVPISHAAAAAVLGLPLIEVGMRVCASPPRNRRGDIPGVHVHNAALYRSDLARIGRLLLTSAARTVVDLGRERGVDAALVAADVALRRGLTDRAALERVLGRARRSPGVSASAKAVALADPRAESVLESLSRLRIHDAGLPAPTPQMRIYDLYGVFCGRVDLYWDEFGVVGECDGYGKYEEDSDSLSKEKKPVLGRTRQRNRARLAGRPDFPPCRARQLISITTPTGWEERVRSRAGGARPQTSRRRRGGSRRRCRTRP